MAQAHKPLARIICKQIDGHFAQLSAVLDGVKELRVVVENAKKFQISDSKPFY
jgi:putative ATPase